MFDGQNITDLRQVFYDAWGKYNQGHSLTALEQQVATIIAEHPEYHPLFKNSKADTKLYFAELGQTNPFLHLGLHLSIREHVATNRPVGINEIYMQLLSKHADKLLVEHMMMDCLAETLWRAQKSASAPDELFYLSIISELINDN